MDLSCIVLAGGKSKRLGRNKLAETIGDKNLLARAISNLSCFNTEIIVVAAQDSVIPELPDYPALKLVQDIYPGKGALGGIYTGLVASGSNYNLVVACDMPFLSIDLLRYMVGQLGSYDVVIPRVNNGVLEPLHAVYSRRCIDHIELLIRQDRLSILDLFPLVNVKYIQKEEIDNIDPEHLSFFNINTEADLIAGKDIARKKGPANDQC